MHKLCVYFSALEFDYEGAKMKWTPTVQRLSQMRGGESEREAETDERNVGTLRTDGRLEDSRSHPLIHRYNAITAQIFTIKSILKQQRCDDL